MSRCFRSLQALALLLRRLILLCFISLLQMLKFKHHNIMVLIDDSITCSIFYPCGSERIQQGNWDVCRQVSRVSRWGGVNLDPYCPYTASVPRPWCCHLLVQPALRSSAPTVRFLTGTGRVCVSCIGDIHRNQRQTWLCRHYAGFLLPTPETAPCR